MVAEVLRLGNLSIPDFKNAVCVCFEGVIKTECSALVLEVNEINKKGKEIPTTVSRYLLPVVLPYRYNVLRFYFSSIERSKGQFDAVGIKGVTNRLFLLA